MAPLITNLLKSKPAVKLAALTTTALVTASIFSSCTKEVKPNTSQPLDLNNLYNMQIEEMEHLLHVCEIQIQQPNLSPEELEAISENMYKLKLAIMDNKIGSYPESLLGQPTDYGTCKNAFAQDNAKLREFAEWHIETFPENCLKPQDYTPARAAYIVVTNPEASNWYHGHFRSFIG